MVWDTTWIIAVIVPTITTIISAIFAIYYKKEAGKRDMAKIIPRFRLTYLRTDLDELRKEEGVVFSKQQYMELRKYRIKRGEEILFIQNRLIFHSYLNKVPPSNIKWECFYITKNNTAKYDSYMNLTSSLYLDDPYFFWPGLVLHNKDILSDNIKEILFRIYYTDPGCYYKFKACHVFKRVREAEWEPTLSDFHNKEKSRCKPEIRDWIKKWKKLGGKKT